MQNNNFYTKKVRHKCSKNMSSKAKTPHKSSFNITRGSFKGMRLNLESNAITRPTKSIVKKSFFDSIQNIINEKIFIECFAGNAQMGFEALSCGAKMAIFFEKDSNAYKNLVSNINIFKEKYKRYYNDIESKVSAEIKDSKIIESYNIDFFNSLDILESLARNIINNEIFITSKNITKNSAKNIESKIKNDIIHTLKTNDFKNVNSNLSRDKIILYIDPPFMLRAGFGDIYDRIITFIESFSENLINLIDIIAIEAQSGIDIAKKIGSFSAYKLSKFGKTTLIFYA